MATGKLDWHRVLTPKYLAEQGADSITCQCPGRSETRGNARTICGEVATRINRARVEGKWADIWQCQKYTNHRFATRSTERERLTAVIPTEKPVFGAPR